jgi:phosphosulfolactate synthase (CoM biosynthesis protein A)
MCAYVDALKFAGSFSLMPRAAVKRIIALCHANDVLVSTGGFIERGNARSQGSAAVYTVLMLTNSLIP